MSDDPRILSEMLRQFGYRSGKLGIPISGTNWSPVLELLKDLGGWSRIFAQRWWILEKRSPESPR